VNVGTISQKARDYISEAILQASKNGSFFHYYYCDGDEEFELFDDSLPFALAPCDHEEIISTIEEIAEEHDCRTVMIKFRCRAGEARKEVTALSVYTDDLARQLMKPYPEFQYVEPHIFVAWWSKYSYLEDEGFEEEEEEDGEG
jgi:hypothetical protein